MKYGINFGHAMLATSLTSLFSIVIAMLWLNGLPSGMAGIALGVIIVAPAWMLDAVNKTRDY